MKLFQYVIPYDHGFAPNPYWGVCTLATCKPRIRRQAQPGDWVVGVGSPRNVGPGKVVYAMRVAEKLPLDEYARDPRFRVKVPSKRDAHYARGDNIYYLGAAGRWKQRSSPFHGPTNAEHDLSGRNVLVSSHFFYFGREAIDVPPEFAPLTTWARDYRSSFELALIQRFAEWIESAYQPGKLGEPCSPRAVDATEWRPGCSLPSS